MSENLNSPNPEDEAARTPAPIPDPEGGASDELVQELREAAGADEHSEHSDQFPAASPKAGEGQNDALMQEAMVSESDADEADPSGDPDPQIRMPDGPVTVHRAEFDTLHRTANSGAGGSNMDLLLDVNLPVSIELGRTQLSISELLELGAGSIVELDKLAGEPVDILVNNKPLAKGEVVVLDEHFGVRITSLVSRRERLEGLGN